MSVTTNWSGTNTCPFCDAELSDPGEGFIEHISRSEECEQGFEDWRENVAGDIAGGWMA